MNKKVIICIDRDGTLIHDERDHLFLGRDIDWQTKVSVLPQVIDGLKLLNTKRKLGIYMITNQPGVAISDYPLLTVEKANEVCLYVIKILKDMGGHIDGHFLCPHATPDYVKSKPGVNFSQELVHECKCLKPELGMVFNAFKAEGLTPENSRVYVIGDRASDVQTGLNVGGVGVLVPFINEPDEENKVKRLRDQSRVYVANDFLDAAQFISNKERHAY